MVARIGLGVFEAGFGPGIPLYFCTHLLITRHTSILYPDAGVLQHCSIRSTSSAYALPTGSDSQPWLVHLAVSLPLGYNTFTLRSRIGVYFSLSRSVSPCDHVVVPVIGSLNTLAGHSRGFPRSHRHIFPAGSTRNDGFFHGGRAGACIG